MVLIQIFKEISKILKKINFIKVEIIFIKLANDAQNSLVFAIFKISSKTSIKLYIFKFFCLIFS